MDRLPIVLNANSNERITGLDESFWCNSLPAVPPSTVRKYVANYQLAKAATGYRFNIHKATGASPRYRYPYTDVTYKQASKDGQAAGFDQSAYHFYHHCQPPILQAEYFIRQTCVYVNGKWVWPYPIRPYLDYEVYVNWWERQKYQGLFLQALVYIEKRIGILPGIYTGLPYWNNLGNPSWSVEFELWEAQYRLEQYVEIIKPWKVMKLRQYTDRAIVPGLLGGVDANYFYGTEDDYAAWKNGTVIDHPVWPKLAEILVNGLRIRSVPDTSGTILGRMNRGDTSLVYEEVITANNLWGKVPNGWICMNYQGTQYVRYKK